MKIRMRLSLWYAAVLTVSLLIIGVGTYGELSERFRREHNNRPVKRALEEVSELFLQVGIPAVLLGLIGGWWLTRRALAPLAGLTLAAERINERNLNTRLPRSGNGDELDRLTEVLNAMTARLNGSFERIREFTLHASHELKTPLTVLRGQTETALRDDLLSLPQRELFASQLEELHRLTHIVDNLTLLTRADAGSLQLTLAPVRLDELVRDICSDTEILAGAAELHVRLDACDPAIVSGDAHRLRQLLLNLADNAVKYNEPHGSIFVRLHCRDGTAEFAIANTGPGIPADVVPRVFDRFFRGDPAHSSDVEGCGLGLSIAQWIVSAHNGTIKIDSTPSQLTTVTVWLPLSAENKSA